MARAFSSTSSHRWTAVLRIRNNPQCEVPPSLCQVSELASEETCIKLARAMSHGAHGVLLACLRAGEVQSVHHVQTTWTGNVHMYQIDIHGPPFGNQNANAPISQQ